MAPWIPLTVVPTSFATVAIETFMTELSSVIRNCPAASVSRISLPLSARAPSSATAATELIVPDYRRRDTRRAVRRPVRLATRRDPNMRASLSGRGLGGRGLERMQLLRLVLGEQADGVGVEG